MKTTGMTPSAPRKVLTITYLSLLAFFPASIHAAALNAINVSGDITLKKDANGVNTGIHFSNGTYQNSASPWSYSNLDIYFNAVGGKVGIGTDSPDSALTVVSSASSPVRIGDSGCGAPFAGIGLFGLMSGCSNYTILGDNGPQKNLFINRPIGADINFRMNNANQMLLDQYGGLRLDMGNTNDGVLHHTATTGAGLSFGSNSGEGIASKRTAGGNQSGLDFYTSGSPRLSITASGNVGIGTLTPTEQLQLTGNLMLPTTSATAGQIRQGTYTLIHSFGNNNFFAGRNAGNLTMSGSENSAIGSYALNSNTTGDYNTANGAFALYSNTTGYSNSANGEGALYSNVSGIDNTANGAFALTSNTIGVDNTANGFKALYSNVSGIDNTANGAFALTSNTIGVYNTANGFKALNFNTTGNGNTANGSLALYANTTGNNNTASGITSLYSNTTGEQNTANGSEALYYNTTGYRNTANGNTTLYSNTTGHSNTANGVQALLHNTTGIDNTANGAQALYNNTTGTNNTAIGAFSGFTPATGSNNTFVGALSDADVDNLSNATAIGHNAKVDASHHVRIGSTSITQIGGQVGWSNLSDIRSKKDVTDVTQGLDFIKQLRPVEYRMKDGNDRKDFGFIAQDVEALLGTEYNVLGIGGDADRTLSLRYTDFIAPLVKAVQEQQTTIERLKADNAGMQARLERLEALLPAK